ncbi:MAG: ComEC/Rec2 family competence protein [Acidimicrobiia bacterium]
MLFVSALLVTAVARRQALVLSTGVLLLLGLHSGGVARAVQPAIEDGPLTFVGVAVGDPSGSRSAPWIVVAPESALVDRAWVRADLPVVLVRGEVPTDIAAGEPVLVTGSARAGGFRVRGALVGGVVDAREIERLGAASNPLYRVGNRLRSHVLGGLDRVAARPEGALLSGFLIGDVSRLPEADLEALRLAGLSHFVAVSGSNVALFLMAWWLVVAPLGWSPRGRALAGLIGLGVFVIVTRWEPSVVRAATMAGIVLGGRVAGVPVRPWTALGVAVGGLIAFDGGIAGQVGFQLSVAATAGILLGAPLAADRHPRWLWTILVATVAAQTAVAPLLLHHFGEIPLLAPATNLVSAPLVAVATSVGGIGAVLHLDLLVDAGVKIAGWVLAVGRGAAGLPQLGTVAVIGLGSAGLVAARFRPIRPVAAIGATALVLAALVPSGTPSQPTVAFLDVGQGDASLLLGPAGEVVLIDGGADPSVLRAHLRDRGVRRIDLLVVSHRHADHAAGLEGVTAVARVERMWHPPQLGEGSPLDSVAAEVAAGGGVVESPSVGTAVRVGSFVIEVVGPLRRYESPNDGSLVLLVEAGGASVLFSGDIEAIAQAELGPLRADVLKVPHQGARTSDLGWLEASAPEIAVISVGPNTFGHPSDEVIATLEAGGSDVRRTDEEGTIVIRLDRVAALPSAR